jgi:hypothetical protein
MNQSGVSKIDERLPIEKINRGKVEGFAKYFQQRQLYFWEIFKIPFTLETAKQEFKKIEQLFWNG